MSRVFTHQSSHSYHKQKRGKLHRQKKRCKGALTLRKAASPTIKKYGIKANTLNFSE